MVTIIFDFYFLFDFFNFASGVANVGLRLTLSPVRSAIFNNSAELKRWVFVVQWKQQHLKQTYIRNIG